jgi:Domain of unknown function (DUF4382)
MRNSAAVIVGGLMIALMGCSKSSSPTGGGSGTVQVNMVDAPASYDQVNVVIDSVEAHMAGSDSTSGWVVLNSVPGSYNLLAYTNGNFAAIASASLPAGQYSQIRLAIGSGSTVVLSGQTYPLTIASGFQSGVKLNVDANVVANVTYTLSLDFDANRSVVQTGNNARATFILKPVIRASSTATTGFIAGVVLPITAKASVWAYDNSGDTVSTNVDALGNFKLMYVPVGTYTLDLVSNSSLYFDSTITQVNVTALATASIGTIILK